MDIRKIRKLIELVRETGMGEIEVVTGDDSVRISTQSSVSSAQQQNITVAAPPPTASAPAAAHPVEAPQSSAPTGHELKSPIVGTVYLAAKPGAKPFVEVGQHVNAGDTVCVIEAMKMFNQIEADVSGKISARIIENEQPVEFDQVLYIIDPD